MSSRIHHALIVLLLAPAGAEAGDLIFADGFESGDVSAWSSATGLSTGCIAGPPIEGAFGGDLGPAPGGAYEEITCVEIRNDRAFERGREIAYSGIPMPQGLNLTTTDGLALIGPGSRRLVAQFDVLSRWGGAVDDLARPIRWLEVSVQPRAPADGAAVYSLRRYDVLPPAADPYEATITPAGGDFVVDTGIATFTLDPANPALIESIEVDVDNDGVGRQTLYSHQPGAGPKMIFDPGGGDVFLDTTEPARVMVDPGGFTVVEGGPVKVVVELRGHFSAPGGASLCMAVTPSYERFGYAVIATFDRASRDVHLQYQFRNECSDAFDQDWRDDAIAVQQASWELPLDAGLQGTITAYHGGAGAVTASAAGFSGRTVVEQGKGGGTPWQRQARVLRDGIPIESAEYFEQPLVAIADGTFLAAAQMPWMRYREPQALAVDGKTLSLRPISEELIVGEAKAIWSFARLRFVPIQLIDGTLEDYLEGVRDAGQAELERGLLVRADLDHFNASGLYAGMGSGAASPIETYYRDTIDYLHQQTVKPGGQWDIAKTFGSQLWPDVQYDFFFPDWGQPADNPVATNYWNPSGAELFEFLRTGDPRFAWEFALPQSWQQTFTAYLNLGEHSHGNRNGFTVAGTGTGEGHWNRAGDLSSDDYNYNYGMQLAYAVRPNAAMRARFGQAGLTVVERYDVPHEDKEDREPFVNTVDLSRLAIQHFEHLANCAEFAPAPRGGECQAKLLEILAELVDDNAGAGVFCGEDIPSNPCSTPQQFMMNAHFYHFFHRCFANYGDVGGLLRRALIESPRAFYDWAIPRLGDGTSIDVATDWPGGMDCTLTGDGAGVVSCAGWTDGDPTFWENRPHTVSLLLMAHALDPSIGLCQIGKDALDALVAADALGSYVGENVGWWKGSAQMMQGLVFAVGGYETCSD
jgi:hypothetical protein